MARTPTAYWDYIRVEELLSLQSGLEPDASKLANDEVMFITIHQIDELWMRLVLRELVAAGEVGALTESHFATADSQQLRDFAAFTAVRLAREVAAERPLPAPWRAAPGC